MTRNGQARSPHPPATKAFRSDRLHRLALLALWAGAIAPALAFDDKAPVSKPAANRASPARGPWHLRNLEGNSDDGVVERIDSEGITFRHVDAEKPERIPWNRIEEVRRGSELAIEAFVEPSSSPFILLPQSDMVRGEAVATLAQGLAVQTVSIGVVNVPLAQWAGVLQSPSTDFVSMNRSLEILNRRPESAGDMILLVNGDRLQGTLLGLDVDNLTFQPTGAAKPVTLPRKGVDGISIDAGTLEYPAVTGFGWKVMLADGSCISAREVNFDPADPEKALNLTTRWGAQWRVPVDKLAGLQVHHPGAIELDTVKPAAIQTVDYVGPTEQPRYGSNIEGGPLKLGQRKFDRGIGTQSRTLLAYRLDGSAKTFTAWVGLDQAAGPKGSARAVVLLDGKPVYDSGPLTSSDLPKRVRVDLGQAKLLILASEFGAGGGIRDWVDWCQPTLRP